jgi:hypothetical protein
MIQVIASPHFLLTDPQTLSLLRTLVVYQQAMVRMYGDLYMHTLSGLLAGNLCVCVCEREGECVYCVRFGLFTTHDILLYVALDITFTPHHYTLRTAYYGTPHTLHFTPHHYTQNAIHYYITHTLHYPPRHYTQNTTHYYITHILHYPPRHYTQNATFFSPDSLFQSERTAVQ